MMTPRQKALIRTEFISLWKEDFGDVEKKLKYAHQVLNLKAKVIGLPNNEIRNALGDARDALDARTFKRAKLKLAYARRHLCRAKLMYLMTAVHGLERLIFQWLRSAANAKDSDLPELRQRAKELRNDRLRMPKLRRASEGGTIDQVQAKTVRLHGECVDWGVLLLEALRIYEKLTD